MSGGDVFLLIAKWLHVLSAAAWVGGGVFYLLALRPAAKRIEPARGFMGAVGSEFGTLVNTSVIVIVATGVVLALDRLSSGAADAPYIVTLGVKSALSLWMFLMVQSLRRQSRSAEALEQLTAGAVRRSRMKSMLSSYEMLVALGLLVFLLSSLLGDLFEAALTRG